MISIRFSETKAVNAFGLLLASFLFFVGSESFAKKCVWIDSYHEGYDWSDGIERGVKKGIAGACDLKIFRMDSKRNKEKADVEKKGLEAKNFIDSEKPDIVIVTDDNAVDQVLMKYYRNAALPFVFSGVNWTIQKYGLPYKNTAGMIEVAPIQQLVAEAKKSISPLKTATLIYPDNETGKKNALQINKIFSAAKVEIFPHFVADIEAFKKSWTEGHDSHLLYLDNNAGIKGWNDKEMETWLTQNTKIPSAGTQDWIGPFVAYAAVKIPDEQGEWAAETAVKIL